MNLIRSERGFTLIELLTVMTVLGVLSALAISQFDQYRRRAFDSRAEHDMRKAITCEEAYFAENDEYVACAGSSCETDLEHFRLSAGVDLVITVTTGPETFRVEAEHPGGLKQFTYDSASGAYTAS